MSIPLILPTAAGPWTVSPNALTIPADSAAALAKAILLERLADLHLSEGRARHADRLSHFALELRCWALGERA